MPLVVAEGPLLDHIVDDTFPVWNEGLTRAAYGRWNQAQLRTPWGSRNLQRVALLADDGSLLASAKSSSFPADSRRKRKSGEVMAAINATRTACSNDCCSSIFL